MLFQRILKRHTRGCDHVGFKRKTNLMNLNFQVRLRPKSTDHRTNSFRLMYATKIFE